MMQRNNEIEICLAALSDAPMIAELEAECFSSPWSENAVKETMSNGSSVFLVAKKEGRICGYIGSYYACDEGYITNVAVSGKHRRKGIGALLIKELIAKGQELKLRFWTLEVRVSNAPAIALYEKEGFERIGKRARFYSNPTEDALLMTHNFK